MAEERIMTLHPEGQVGVNIAKDKYDVIADAIRKSLNRRRELTSLELITKVGEKLEGKFEGSIPWYVSTVELDLQARGVLERVADKSPQVVRLVK